MCAPVNGLSFMEISRDFIVFANCFLIGYNLPRADAKKVSPARKREKSVLLHVAHE